MCRQAIEVSCEAGCWFLHKHVIERCAKIGCILVEGARMLLEKWIWKWIDDLLCKYTLICDSIAIIHPAISSARHAED